MSCIGLHPMPYTCTAAVKAPHSTQKMNLRSLWLRLLSLAKYVNCRRIFLEEFSQDRIHVQKQTKTIGRRGFTPSVKRCISTFHVEKWTSKKYTEVSDARVLLLFSLLKQLVIDVLVAAVVVVALWEAVKLTENLNEQMANK